MSSEENGVMQYIHDIALSSGGVLEFVEVESLGSFNTTRVDLVAPQGVSGDAGANLINGYTTSFIQGLAGASDLYVARFEAVAMGSTSITVAASAEAKFAASTAGGLKIGHTDNNGNPATVNYPAAIAIDVTAIGKGDVDGSTIIDINDMDDFVDVLLEVDLDAGKRDRSDMNCDGTPDGLDVQLFVEKLL